MSNNVPSDEDFARARALMRQRDSGLSEVRATILHRFSPVGLYEAFVLYSPGSDRFVTYLFFKDQPSLEAARSAGTIELIKDVVLDELVHVGRGQRD